jgi:hypothetical protein
VADINNRAGHGRFLNIKPDIGLLKSTARTFIQDGVKTEYVTKVIGTTIDNGQYVQLLTTTSRVLFNTGDNLQTKTVNQNSIDHQNEDVAYISSPPSSPFLQNVDYIVPSNPYLVFPARKQKENNNEFVVMNNNNNVNNVNDNENEESEISLAKTEKFVVDEVKQQLPKPDKVVSGETLPTYVVSHNGPIFSPASVPQADSAPRVGKILTFEEEEVKAENENKILPSVTYYGFADFTTTVGGTIIVFSPSTAKAQIDIKDRVTSIVDEPTLNIKPTSTKQQNIDVQTVEPTLSSSSSSEKQKNEPKFTPKIVESISTTLPTTPKYVPTEKVVDVEKVDTTTEDFTTTSSEEEEDDEDSTESTETTLKIPSTTPTTTSTTEKKKPQILVVGVSPDAIEPSQVIDSSSSSSSSYSKPSEEDILKVLASLNAQKPDTSIIKSSPPVVKVAEPETKILTGSSIIFFDDITTQKPPPTTTKSDDDDSEEDSNETTNNAPETTTEQNNLAVKPLTQKQQKSSICSSTVFNTQTQSTTFYIPINDELTTTSIRTKDIVSSSVIGVECKPSIVVETTTEKAEDNESTTPENAPVFIATTPETTTMEIVTESSTIDEETTVENSEDEDFDIIHKTLYTTYTYYTTFFQDATTSVSTRKDVITNVITSTINANDFASLLNKLEPSKMIEEIEPTQVTDVGIGRPTEKFVLPENDFIGVNQLLDGVEKVDYTPALSDDDVVNSQIKTLYTTYTYYTTLFNEGKSDVVSRTEVYTNIINPSSSLSNILQKDILETKYVSDPEMINNQLSEDRSDMKEAKKLKLEGILEGNDIKSGEGEKAYSTMIRGVIDLQASSSGDEGDWDDVKSSTSDGESRLVDSIDRRTWSFEGDDQISSESNIEEGIQSPTLLLQTRYTTFTYYTTLFDGASSSSIVSRLETLTNVVTETLSPTQVQKLDDATVPVTYFTTFTYWTTFFKDGTTRTTSREETVSNVVTPSVVDSSVVPSSVIVESSLPTFIADSSSSSDASHLLVAPLETNTPKNPTLVSSIIEPSTVEPSSSSSSSDVVAIPVIDTIEPKAAEGKALEPSTYFTTYTYYTTNYVGDETKVDSRFETETNVVTPTVEVKQAKAIDIGKLNDLNAGDKKGLKEKSVEKSNVAIVAATVASKQTPTAGVVSINHGKIIDADGITTTHFTTQAVGTYIDSFYAEVLETSSSIEVDEIRKAIQPTEVDSSPKQHKTGLVRLIDGTIVNKNATTLYESKVIGTFIDGRYAQVIESTSSIIAAKAIQPSSVVGDVNIQPTASNGNIVSPKSSLINPTSAVIEGSISDTPNNEDDSKAVNKKFTPVIRPFGTSKSRPVFNPKKKSSSNGPAIITPTEITPTIRATAVKSSDSSRRGFGGPRRSSAAISPSIASSAPSGGSGSTSSRRFGRPSSSRANSIQASPTVRPSRTSVTPRIQPSASVRSRPAFNRSSLSVSARVVSSSVPVIGRANRIRPTGVLEKTTPSPSTAQVTQDSDDGETTNVTDIPSDLENENAEISTTTTTENPRRRGNPLLGRRPGFSGRVSAATTTPRSVQISTRRNPLSRTSRVTTSTTTTTPAPRTTRGRALLRPSLPPVTVNSNANRQRQSAGSLFPPRGLLNKQSTTTPAAQEIDVEEDENQSSEDFEEYDETNVKEVKATAPKKRSKRQTNFGTRSPDYNPRFKRPSTAKNSRADYYTYDSEELIVTEAPPKPRTSSRFNSRSRLNNNNNDNAENTKIKPTTSSSQNSRSLFTLRDKDTNTTPRSNFRRPGVNNLSSGRRVATTTRASSNRFRNYGQQDQFSSRSGTNNNRRTTNRGRGTTRHSGRRTADADTAYLPKNDGTITVTHHIPTEVTIPVVVGKNTEYKNVITAKPSTEILGPKQYSTSVGNNGLNTLVILEEKTTVNQNGQTEITQYFLSETPTTSIIFTPTTIRGRKTSFSHVIPSTVYDAHPVVSTITPQGLSNNAPLANILLSQLLLGNIGFPQQQAFNPLLGIQQQQQPNPVIPQPAPATPVTEFKTRTTSYVTTIHQGKSTVLPVTFRGSRIYTTVYDESSMVITATEFITDTIVVTPTQVQAQQPQLNSLLLPFLLQQQQNQPSQQQQLLNSLQNINTLPTSFDILNREALESISLGDDKQIQSVTKDEIQQNSKEEDYEDEKPVEVKQVKRAKNPQQQQQQQQNEKKLDTSVITLYVSGRRPGEFSTVLSTVVSDNPVYKRSAPYVDVKASDLPTMDVLEAEASDNYFEYILAGSSNDINPEPTNNDQETESLDFVLGDYNKFTSSVLL